MNEGEAPSTEKNGEHVTGRTHVIVGAAAGVAATSALGLPVAVTELAAAAAGGALGGTLPDLDVRDTAHPLRGAWLDLWLGKVRWALEGLERSEREDVMERKRRLRALSEELVQMKKEWEQWQ